MLSLQSQLPNVNGSLDQPCPLERDCQSRYGQLRRVLTLIDIMAPLRRPHSTHELHGMLNDKTGNRWHFRTVTRDLVMLAEQGLVTREYRTDFLPCSTKTALWKLNLKTSEPVQEAAIKVLDSEPETRPSSDIEHDPSSRCWQMILYDIEEGTYRICKRGASKKVASYWVRYWEVRRMDIVLFAWPEWVPLPAEIASKCTVDLMTTAEETKEVSED